jgi:hypothetical protein
LYDNGIHIVGSSFIPYEYVLCVQNKKFGTSISILGKIEDKNIKIADDYIQIYIKYIHISNTIMNNIIYHIKYNKINKEIFNFKTIKIKKN